MIVSDITKPFSNIYPVRFSFLPMQEQFHKEVLITDDRGVILYKNENRKTVPVTEAPERKKYKNGTRLTFKDIFGEIPEFLRAIEAVKWRRIRPRHGETWIKVLRTTRSRMKWEKSGTPCRTPCNAAWAERLLEDVTPASSLQTDIFGLTQRYLSFK